MWSTDTITVSAPRSNVSGIFTVPSASRIGVPMAETGPCRSSSAVQAARSVSADTITRSGGANISRISVNRPFIAMSMTAKPVDADIGSPSRQVLSPPGSSTEPRMRRVRPGAGGFARRGVSTLARSRINARNSVSSSHNPAMR